MEGEGRRKGRKGKGRGGEVDPDAQLEQGRRLAKAGPVSKTHCEDVLYDSNEPTFSWSPVLQTDSRPILFSDSFLHEDDIINPLSCIVLSLHLLSPPTDVLVTAWSPTS